MSDRFTDRARKAMGLARQEAQRLGHDTIGTEHVLLGLVLVGSGVATSVLKNLSVDLEAIRHEVEKLVSNGTAMVTMGQLPFTPRAKKALEFSLDESDILGHNRIGTEHLLLGLIREGRGIAAQALRILGMDLGEVRSEVLDLLGAEPRGTKLVDEDVPLTPPAKWACLRAHAAATDRGRRVGPLHLLYGLLDVRDAEIEGLLAQWGVSPEGLRKNVEGRLDRAP